jgi:DNA mismatch repair protein MutL
VAAYSLYQALTKKNQAHFIEPGETGTTGTANKSNGDAGKDLSDPGHHGKGGFISLKDHLEARSLQETASTGEGLQYTIGASGSAANIGDKTGPTNRTLPVEGAVLSQMLNTYIITPTNRGLMMINQQAAHERVLYELYSAAAAGKTIPSQQSLFPVTLQLATQDAVLLTELLKDLHLLGYLVEPFGKDSFVIQGTPSGMSQGNERATLEDLLEQFKNFSSELKFSKREKLIRSLARQHAIKTGTALEEKEMRGLITSLFECVQPNISPTGDPTYIEFRKDYLEKLFSR